MFIVRQLATSLHLFTTEYMAETQARSETPWSVFTRPVSLIQCASLEGVTPLGDRTLAAYPQKRLGALTGILGQSPNGVTSCSSDGTKIPATSVLPRVVDADY